MLPCDAFIFSTVGSGAFENSTRASLSSLNMQLSTKVDEKQKTTWRNKIRGKSFSIKILYFCHLSRRRDFGEIFSNNEDRNVAAIKCRLDSEKWKQTLQGLTMLEATRFNPTRRRFARSAFGSLQSFSSPKFDTDAQIFAQEEDENI